MSGLGRGKNQPRNVFPGGMAAGGNDVKAPPSTTSMTLDQWFSYIKQSGPPVVRGRRRNRSGSVGSMKSQRLAAELAERYGGQATPHASEAKIDRARRIAKARAARDGLQGRFGEVANQLGFRGGRGGRGGRGRGMSPGRGGMRGRGRGRGRGQSGWGDGSGAGGMSMRGGGRGGGPMRGRRGSFSGRGGGGQGSRGGRGRGGGRGRPGFGRGRGRGQGRGPRVSKETLDQELDAYQEEGKQDVWD